MKIVFNKQTRAVQMRESEKASWIYAEENEFAKVFANMLCRVMGFGEAVERSKLLGGRHVLIQSRRARPVPGVVTGRMTPL